MSCSCQPQQACNCKISFKVDEGFLVPYVNLEPLTPIDLTELIQAIETQTRLQFNADDRTLIYTGEEAENGGTPDTLSLKDIFEVMQLADLGDVQFTVTSNGDLLYYNGNNWTAYTPPEGTIVSSLGVDVDGNIVKQLASDPLPGSVEVPIGMAMVWPGDPSDLPANFVPMDGRALSRTVYAALFALWGTLYGAGNGTTTFNIPNYNGRVPAGVDASQTEFTPLGKTVGAKTHTLTQGEMPPHSHGVNDPGHSHNLRGFNAAYPGGAGSADDGVGVEWTRTFDTRGGGITGSGTGIFLSNAGGGAAHNNLQPTIAQWWVVRII
jgi:microcystin-dependent protein